jgi:hypothetical protein
MVGRLREADGIEIFKKQNQQNPMMDLLGEGGGRS